MADDKQRIPKFQLPGSDLPGSDLPGIEQPSATATKSNTEAPAVAAQHELDSHYSMPPARKKRWPLVVIVAIVVLVLVAGAVIAWQVHSTEQLKAQRAEGYTILDVAIARIQAADVTIMAIDAAVNTEITEQTPPQHEVLLEQAARTRETLSEATQQASVALSLFADSSDSELAQHVIDTANARLSMIDSGTQLIGFDIKALYATEPLSKAWEAVVKADEQMRNAAEQTAKATPAGVRAAIKLNQKAQKSLKSASDDLESAVNAFNNLDVGVLANYVRLKNEAVKLAIETDRALLANDLKTAEAKNAEFAKKDAEVVGAAGAIPDEPMDILTLSYESSTADLHQNYVSARSAAADSDIFIRAYVGVETAGKVQ
jgi:hypothetical protein